jgi:hypothetical protein
MNDDEWKLSPEEREKIFDEILREALKGVKKPEQPIKVDVGGQAGSSKTTARNRLKERFSEDGAIIADYDALLEKYPRYRELQKRNDQTAAQSAAGEYAYMWMNGLIDYAHDHGFHLLREGHMGGEAPEREATKFRAKGFVTEADVMAVPDVISRTANLLRYLNLRMETGYGRLVGTGIYYKGYSGIPNTLQGVFDRKFYNVIRLHQWGGGVIYENSLDAAMEWRHNGNPRIALEEHREKPLSRDQVQWLQKSFAYLDRYLPPELQSDLVDLRRLGARVGVSLPLPGGPGSRGGAHAARLQSPGSWAPSTPSPNASKDNTPISDGNSQAIAPPRRR